MAVIKAKGQITIIDQNDAVSFQAFIGSNQPLTQIYSQDNNSYLPSWATSPFLVLTPQLFISGIPGDSASVAGRIKPGSAQWRRDNVLLTNTADYVISATAPYTLTVKKNDVTGSGNVKYTFSAIFVDPNNGMETPFSAVISFNTVQNAGSGLLAVITADQGTIFQNDQIASLTLTCDLYRASEVLVNNVQYNWGKRDMKVFAPTTATAAANIGQNTITLANVANVQAGSQIRAAGVTYTALSVNSTSKVVTLTSNLTAAVASGAAVTSPHYDTTFGAGWAKISSDPYFNGITGFNAKTLVIPNAAVLNLEVFKCLAKDNSTGASTSGQTAQAVETLNDMSDPIDLKIWSPDGDIIKNGSGTIQLTVDVRRGGELIDVAGTEYTYTWAKYDQNGDADVAFSRTGKSITILPADVTNKATFVCTLMSV
ncbi:hypothetical protein [Sphingobacterium cavernae]|uniref:hypothetical protein n=1 Tax=Sphingobacterium cavernae TaxID=2592657 RepID=UPI00122FEAF0|nr:hypothetical protein [Sphingobacterium cavernae]